MRTTLGIDLASQPENTALCVIAWDEPGARVAALARSTWNGERLTDAHICDAALGRVPLGGSDSWGADGRPATVAIDAPFGWPEPFVHALTVADTAADWPMTPDAPRMPLERRTTDRVIHAHVGKLPLSVSTDRIAYPAMRCAAILAELGRHLGPAAVERDGSGVAAEAYPDAALRRWLPALWATPRPPSYKGAGDGPRARRAEILTALRARIWPSLDMTDKHVATCLATDDGLDALVCALVARAIMLGETLHPQPGEEHRLARSEGWIHIPSPDALSDQRASR